MTAELSGFLLRMRIQSRLRHALERRGYQEVSTPILQECPGSDPEIEPMTTDYFPLLQPSSPRRLFLHTSPEFAMKRLLCRGFSAIYQIVPVFRQGEHGPLHFPEFTMVEWYREGFSWTELMAEVEEVVREAVGDKLNYLGREINLTSPLPRLPVKEAMEAAGVKLSDWDGLSELAWLDKYFRAFVEKLDPWLRQQGALFLIDFPAPLSLMSRSRPDNPALAERFELIIAGIELANGASELTDPQEHRRRFLKDQEIRKLTHRDPHPIPAAFLEDLENFGLPECAGVGLGIERLAMIVADSPILESVLPFPFGR